MFVKVTAYNQNGPAVGAAVVNTHWIITLDPDTRELEMFAGGRYKLTPESFDYLLLCVETQDALATEAPEPPSLKTRIAQALRYEFPSGAVLHDLESHFSDQRQDRVQISLDQLVTDHVVIFNSVNATYHHAANLTRNPDPEAEV